MQRPYKDFDKTCLHEACHAVAAVSVGAYPEFIDVNLVRDRNPKAFIHDLGLPVKSQIAITAAGFVGEKKWGLWRPGDDEKPFSLDFEHIKRLHKGDNILCEDGHQLADEILEQEESSVNTIRDLLLELPMNACLTSDEIFEVWRQYHPDFRTRVCVILRSGDAMSTIYSCKDFDLDKKLAFMGQRFVNDVLVLRNGIVRLSVDTGLTADFEEEFCYLFPGACQAKQ